MREIAHYLSILCTIWVVLILLRVLASWIPDLDRGHRALRILAMLVDPVLRPFRAVLPPLGGLDLSPLLALVLLQTLGGALDDYYRGFVPTLLILALLVVRNVVVGILSVMAVIVFVRLILSVFRADPWHPLVVGVRTMSRPLVQPFASVLPRSRTVDTAAISALVALVAGLLVSRAILDTIITHSY